MKHVDETVPENNAANDWRAFAVAFTGTRWVPVSVTVAVAVFFSRVVVRMEIVVVTDTVTVDERGAVNVRLARHDPLRVGRSECDTVMFAAGVAVHSAP